MTTIPFAKSPMWLVRAMIRMCLFALTPAMLVKMVVATLAPLMPRVEGATILHATRSATPRFQDAEAVCLTRNVWVSMAFRRLCAILPTVSAVTA